MQKILFNLAHIDVLSFCKQNGIDPAGSHLVKDGRGYKYTLVRSDTRKPIASVTFTKNTVPNHCIY